MRTQRLAACLRHAHPDLAIVQRLAALLGRARHPDLAVVAYDAAQSLRPHWSTAEFTALAEAVIVDVELREALICLWDRRDRLTPFELDVLAAILEDGGR